MPAGLSLSRGRTSRDVMRATRNAISKGNRSVPRDIGKVLVLIKRLLVRLFPSSLSALAVRDGGPPGISIAHFCSQSLLLPRAFRAP